MKVILLETVEKVGKKGDVLNVAPGFARNYLIPRKLAMEVTPSNIKMVEMRQKALKKKEEKERLSYQELIKKLNEVHLEIRRRSSEKDVIFGSVSAADIQEELAKLGFEVDKKKIMLDEPIKRLGTFTIPIKIYHDERAEIKVTVSKEETTTSGSTAEEQKNS
ncbi:MAG TPA: 50S ribosomal protein L9 [Candidatus Saccharicenans sp.]|jgi:large subunit ribosomal protein L9|nr:50S ribosomal protein L9 [Candidatus Saccharicenans sp.]HOL45456.1 50S ribosomal protein L9 [Candidatus Saccharicenans sp.]HOM94372.1 50S ribosomal protein L9 [Candidatus Saccharicenans sp.]HPC88125.1 50S ribosomal protein L9 [Candidatus Saccharicenans sp.]HPP23835.1 50S ribosomal protein L9 [Candidatus Saccharicenans sp.]